MKKISLVILVCLMTINVFSQEKVKKYKYSLGISYGLNLIRDANFENNWFKLDPNFVAPSFTDTNFRTYNFSSSSLNPSYGLNFSFSKNDDSKKHTITYRFSYQKSDGVYAYQNWSKSSSFAYDTLTSSKNGSQYFIDSNVNEFKSKTYSSSLHKLNFGILIHKKLKKRFETYLGLELGFGLTTKNHVYSTNSTYYGIGLYNQGYQSQTDQIDYHHSQSKAETLFALSSNIPIGINYTLGKKENFLSKIALSYEISFGNNLFFNQELGKINQFYMKNLIGIKYSF